MMNNKPAESPSSTTISTTNTKQCNQKNQEPTAELSNTTPLTQSQQMALCNRILCDDPKLPGIKINAA